MATTNYGFTKLAGTDTAGHTSINTCIDSIDTQLEDKTFVVLMVILYRGVTAPSGWSIVTPTGAPAVTDHIWIEKQA
tara:strand:+ start:43 stop:273 length:231 start_codon:yes stop_codon:yes gene_type:complete